jgi:tetratricopeptide (TPR) repeat protein
MLKESARIYQNALRIDPKNREVLDRLIRALGQQGEHDNVIELLEGQVKSSRDPGLMALLAQAYLGKDRLKDAKKLLQKAASIDSESVDIRVALGRLQLKQGEVAEAYQSLLGASEQLEQHKKLTEASHLWEEFIREKSDHAEALAKLEDLYRRNEHPAKANATASSLADVLASKQRIEEAREVLNRLVECDGGNPRHRERLENLERQGLGPPTPAAGPPSLVPEPEIDVPDVSVPEPAPEAATPTVGAGPVSLEELPEGGEPEDQEYISERLTEAEVFVKYGLVDKALEQLKSVLKRFPRCIQARGKLRDLYYENGDPDHAVGECLHLARILRGAGDGPAARQVLEEALDMGGSPELLKHVREALGGEAVDTAAAPEEEVSVDLEPAAAQTESPLEEGLDLDLDLALGKPQVADKPEQEEELELELTPEEPAEAAEEAAAQDEIEGGLEIEIESPGQPVPSEEELKEVDFYLEQGLEDEARLLLLKLQERMPGAGEVETRLKRLGVEPAAAAAPAAASENILEEIGRELQEDQEEVVVPVEAAEASEGGAAEFFDLSSEIDESLFETQTAVEVDLAESAPGEEEHSLDEIFKAFKKGVEQQVEETDYETHYNLGIAYKEMGLIEEAIGEFQIAAKDTKRLVQCCSMLGICFREKGMTNLAVKWYQRGLESPSDDDEEYQGLKYDLAVLYMEMGDYARSQELFTDVYGVNAKYRDVSKKIKEIEKLIGQAE